MDLIISLFMWLFLETIFPEKKQKEIETQSREISDEWIILDDLMETGNFEDLKNDDPLIREGNCDGSEW